VKLLREHPEGLRNAAISGELELDAARPGRDRAGLSRSVLGLLIEEGLVIRDAGGRYRTAPGTRKRAAPGKRS